MISVPNVANITVRVALALGKFEYSERGIMDKSHLRFFTRKTARELLADSGFDVVEERATTMPLDLALGLPSKNLVVRGLNRALAFLTALFPRLLGYQWVFVVEPRTVSGAKADDDTGEAHFRDSVAAAGAAH
jgi:hypothetical protein